MTEEFNLKLLINMGLIGGIGITSYFGMPTLIGKWVVLIVTCYLMIDTWIMYRVV